VKLKTAKTTEADQAQAQRLVIREQITINNKQKFKRTINKKSPAATS